MYKRINCFSKCLFLCFLTQYYCVSFAGEQSIEHRKKARDPVVDTQSIDASQPENEKFIRIGSTKAEVADTQGTPTRITHYSEEGEWWYYGYSRIDFKNGRVVAWDNDGPLKVTIHNKQSSIKKELTNASRANINKSQYKNSELSVAENGSYKGEISGKTGRPKNTYIPGYYRKNGTYVRGHYRS